MKGVFLDSRTISLPAQELKVLTQTLPDWQLYPQTAQHEVAERIKEADIIVTNKVPLDAKVLQQARCRCICVAATGFDHIDLQAAKANDTVVCNIRHYSTYSVSQLTMGLVLALVHHLDDYLHAVKTGLWQQSSIFTLARQPTVELYDKVFGIIGFGAIGQQVAKIAEAFGMNVVVAQRKNDVYQLDDWLPKVDILSLHCPLTEKTQKIINATTLGRMKKSAYLVNTARGGLIDETALLKALSHHKIAGAALDVLREEPPSLSCELLNAKLPNLLVTPHMAWCTIEAQRRLLAELVANIEAFKCGKPKNSVLPTK